MPGYPITKTDLDNRMGAQFTALRDAFDAIIQLKAELDDTSILPDATLTSMGYTSGDITQIRAAYTDARKLWDISIAAATQASTNDFWFNIKHLVGLNLH